MDGPSSVKRPKLKIHSYQISTSDLVAKTTSSTAVSLDKVDEKGTPMLVDIRNSLPSFEKMTKCHFGYLKSSSKDIGRRNERLSVAEGDRITYCGKNHQFNDMSTDNEMKYVIGVYDERTQELECIDADYYRLHVHYAGEFTKAPSTDQPISEELSKKQMNERLVREFGSSKGKRLVDAKERNMVTGSALTDSIAPAVSSATLPASTSIAENKVVFLDEESLMPKPHTDATNLEEAYLISDLISEGEMGVLTEASRSLSEATSTQIGDWRKSETYPAFLLDMLATMHIYKVEDRLLRCSGILYIHYLIFMYNLKSTALQKFNPLPTLIPELIRKRLLAQFTVSTQLDGGKFLRCMPKRLKDAVLVRILLLCLIIMNFNYRCSTLKKELKISNERLKLLVQSLGGRVQLKRKTSSDEDVFMMLPWPLQFVEQKERKARRQTR